MSGTIAASIDNMAHILVSGEVQWQKVWVPQLKSVSSHMLRQLKPSLRDLLLKRGDVGI